MATKIENDRQLIGKGAQEQRESSENRRKVRGRPFPKGISGNPGGRPKGTVSLRAAVKRLLTKADANIIARKLIEEGKAGNTAAIKLLLNYLPDDDYSDDPLAGLLRGI